MHFYVIRHGDPDYENDTITEYGWQQARALADKLAPIGIDEIYASPMGRAQDTAKPLAQRLGLPITIVPWAAETALNIFTPNHILRGEALYALGEKWYTHPDCPNTPEAIEKELKVQIAGLDELLAAHGYSREGDLYKITDGNDKRIALFCHCGVGTTFFARLWGVLPNIMWASTDLYTTGVTHFWLQNYDTGYTSPRCLCINDISHLYQAGIMQDRRRLLVEK